MLKDTIWIMVKQELVMQIEQLASFIHSSICLLFMPVQHSLILAPPSLSEHLSDK
jgi:hypothetical protein